MIGTMVAASVFLFSFLTSEALMGGSGKGKNPFERYKKNIAAIEAKLKKLDADSKAREQLEKKLEKEKRLARKAAENMKKPIDRKIYQLETKIAKLLNKNQDTSKLSAQVDEQHAKLEQIDKWLAEALGEDEKSAEDADKALKKGKNFLNAP
jgi:DNA repair ATPase RecN